jgi:2',3'-cyclic-nucleotide 2'-phosphodiesterase (5'-nucleotidase family)
MSTHARRFSWVLSTFLLAAAAVAATTGCDRERTPDGHTGTLAVSLMGADGVAGFRFDVAGPDGFSDSRLVKTGEIANAFFTLRPGAYTVTATAVDDAGVPVARCAPSTGQATVTRGHTTTLVLVVRCQGDGRGGLDVTARTDHEPEISGIAFQPSTSVAPCEALGVTVSASDADQDPLTYRFAVLDAPPGPAPVFTLEVAGNQATFVGALAGDYLLEVAACDPRGCVPLSVPLHVGGDPAGGGACVVSCDDGNPCTADLLAAGGICQHSPIADGTLCAGGNLRVKLLGLNDFHGQLDEGRRVANRPVGGAAVLASYLRAAQAGMEDQTIIVHAGDHVGASPPSSALLQDEPSISVFNLLANAACSYMDRMDPACNMVGTPGNHEFDEGKGELFRLIGGGNFPAGPFLEDPYRGARFPYVSANVVDEITGQPVLPPLVVKRIHGVPVAFIGAVLKATPTIVTPSGVAGVRFLDEADAINAYVPGLVAAGVRAIVVTIHQGGFQTNYIGPTAPSAMLTSGPEILDIVNRLSDEIDVVVSGHTHAFANAFVRNAGGKQMLLTSAFSAGTAYGDVDLLVDPVTHDVVSKTAQIVTTFGDAGPGLTPDPMVAAIVTAAQTRVGPLVNRVVGFANNPFTRAQNAAGESTLGDLIADAQRAAMGTRWRS